MKYMGSKRYMLDNGLGLLISKQIIGRKRFVDLFCGAGYVSRFVSDRFNIPVLASDLQKYATTLTGAIIERTVITNTIRLEEGWIKKAEKSLKLSDLYRKAINLEKRGVNNIKLLVKNSRFLCERGKNSIGPIWKAYGGHYFSPVQALSIDYLIRGIPEVPRSKKLLCLASVIVAASKCAAAPGHTAQPFQPTAGAKKYLYQSWQLNIFQKTIDALRDLSQLKANVKGKTVTKAAEEIINQLNPEDLVFIDPPYSGVQYSRFYHVLETIARNKCGLVYGVGRYPDLKERPQSAFSNSSQSQEALKNLMEKIAEKGSSVIFTFPNKECSNGLSGKIVKEIVKEWFCIAEERIHGRFSTLGGNNSKDSRPGRQKSEELLLFLQPK